jgi:ABC-2 type transport system permease protein
MIYVYIALIAAAVGLRVWIFRTRRARRARNDPVGDLASSGAVVSPAARSHTGRRRRSEAIENALGDVGLVAGREIRERIRGRIFRFGTLVLLIAVAAAIIIPTLHSSSSSGPTIQTVGIVGPLSSEVEQVVHSAGAASKDVVRIVPERSLTAAETELRSGKIDLAVIGGNQVLTNLPATAASSPADPTLVQNLAGYLGVVKAYRAGGLTPRQATLIDNAKSVAVRTLRPNPKPTTNGTSLFGLILLFVMLTQYNTWILIGVMQEKSSRVVEVLLATVRPLQLLGGKVLGIGFVALGQATLLVGFALILAKAVGSDLLHGSAPLVLASQLLWLVLGYTFYCWVYAAAGSTAERQDQIQTLAFPLSIPILVGYIFSITVISSGHADLLYKVFAYLPPTAPFCMPVLVGLGLVTWWEFVASVLISLVGTVGMAIFAARIYRRAVLRTGGRVRFGQLLARTPRSSGSS